MDVFGCIGHDGEALRQDSTIVDGMMSPFFSSMSSSSFSYLILVTGATSDTAIAIEIEEKPAVPSMSCYIYRVSFHGLTMNRES